MSTSTVDEIAREGQEIAGRAAVRMGIFGATASYEAMGDRERFAAVHLATLCSAVLERGEEIERLRGLLREARALVEHADHRTRCSYWGSRCGEDLCDCGLDDLKSRIDTALAGSEQKETT